jgi:hypothetical protein
VPLPTYNSKISTIESNVTSVTSRATALEGRASGVEGRVSSIETDISVRVDTAISNKVAQSVFDSLASTLRGADSELNSTLQTKVIQTVQLQKDADQSTLIAQKVDQTVYTAKISTIDAKDLSQDGVIATKLNITTYTNKIMAVEEFINLAQMANYINVSTSLFNPQTSTFDSELYVYNGTFQNIPIPQ